MAAPLVGMVNVAGKRLEVCTLGAAEELRLAVLLRKMQAEETGNAYRRAKATIDEMPKHLQADAARECIRVEAAMELPGYDAMLMARTSPKGVALELWMRARKAHPDLRLVECEAIVTDTNCLEVLSDMIRELTPPEGGDDTKSGPANLGG